MDSEQLTLILETIQSMGGDAKEFGIWWMVCIALPKVISDVLLFLFGCLVLKLVFYTVKACRDADSTYVAAQKEIRQEIRTQGEADWDAKKKKQP